MVSFCLKLHLTSSLANLSHENVSKEPKRQGRFAKRVPNVQYYLILALDPPPQQTFTKIITLLEKDTNYVSARLHPGVTTLIPK